MIEKRARTPPAAYNVVRSVCDAVGARCHVAVYGDGWAMRAFGASVRQFGPVKCYAFIRESGIVGATLVSMLMMHEAAKLVVCPDSFGLHAAAAFDVPTLALWNLDPAATGDDGDPIPAPGTRMGTYSRAEVVDMQPGGARDRAIEGFVREVLG